MFKSAVEEWLYAIGLPELYPYFLEEGFDTLEKIKHMRQTDIDLIVDRRGYIPVLNEEIDRLNFGNSQVTSANVNFDRSGREESYISVPEQYETRESIIHRYESGGIPAVGFASRQLARRAKSKTRKDRAASLISARASVDRYIPNSASAAFENLFAAKRAASVAAITQRELEHDAMSVALEERQKKREEERQKRSKTGKKNPESIILCV
jgi:hypothetical protein